MKDERYKQLMEQLGMPNSNSLLSALQQVANEVAQQAIATEREACANECEWVNENTTEHPEMAITCADRIRARSNVQSQRDAQALLRVSAGLPGSAAG